MNHSNTFDNPSFLLGVADKPSIYFEAICKEFFPDLEYRVMPKNETWRFAHLVVPSLSNHRDGILTPHMPPWIRYLANLIVGEDIKPSRKIFITRKDAMNRNIKNQNELLMALKGWETVTLENLSIRDQVKTFAEATHIVSPHGAGLTNLLWCRPKTKVYELTHKAFIGKIVYPSLSHHLELKHHVILCDTEKISGKKPRNKKQKDMVNLKINVKDFISYID